MMRRREFIKNTLLVSSTAALAQACSTGGKDTGNPSDKKVKVVLIGVDGANWPTLDPLIDKGNLPFWKKLKEETAWTEFKTFKPTKSSVVWTSIATGTSMLKHGILDFTFLDKNKIEVPYSNTERREPTLWQILSDYRKKSIIVNWFVSHPPDKIDGILVSDNFRRVVARPLDKIDEYKDSVYPSIYFHKLLNLGQRDYREVFKQTGLPDYPTQYEQLHPGTSFRDVPILQTYRSMAVQDYFVTNITKELYRTKEFDLFATYIRMPDLVQHFSARLFEEGYHKEVVKALQGNSLTPEKRKEVILKIADIIEPAYRFAQDLMESLITFKLYEDAYFIICSDHGFSLYPGGYNHYGLPDDYEAPSGILMIKGPDVQPGHFDSACVYDIAPTILNLLDLPVGKNMDGKVLHKVFKQNRRIQYKMYQLKKEEGQRKSSKADEEALKELKSIGYIN